MFDFDVRFCDRLISPVRFPGVVIPWQSGIILINVIFFKQSIQQWINTLTHIRGDWEVGILNAD